MNPLSSPPPPAAYSLRWVREVFGLSRSVLASLIASGVVAPARGPGNQRRFSFQDLMLLRTARGLQQAGIRPARIRQALVRLRRDLPPELPLTGLRISAVGRDVAVRDRHGRLQAPTGQWLMAFDADPVDDAAVDVGVARLPRATLDETAAESLPDRLFGRAAALEEAGLPAEAESAYRQAIAADPVDARAYLNLGALLCESGRYGEAIALYRGGLKVAGGQPLLHFNLAVAFESAGEWAEAVAGYQCALALDADLADAHYNLAGLLQRLGDRQGALRHLNAYRRIERRATRPDKG